jgi:ParB-like chromosome segregation protein Spo0J
MMKDVKDHLFELYINTENKIDFVNEVNEYISELNPLKHNPVCFVKWVKAEQIKPNEYNPNFVASKELELLNTSIERDGYTQPIVTIWDGKFYIIVDGFHRYYVMLSHPILMQINKGYLPITIIKKGINDRMASTIRHNRARGKHNITGMSNLVFQLLDKGWDDTLICKELGMEAEELIRLKHITGFSKLFENTEYRKAWKTRRMVEIEAGVGKKI